MNTEKFADFLRERRKALGLTQEQLAEKLHVSTAAVSKWERGKSLPDIAKIEDLAAALEVSVLEVLRGELSAEPLDKEPLKEVYAQTLRTAQQQKKKKRSKVAVVLAILLVLLLVFPVYRLPAVLIARYPSHDNSEIALLAFVGMPDDIVKGQAALHQAEKAFSDTSCADREEAVEKYGLLSRYVPYSRNEKTVVEETHTLRLWSARFYGNRGCVWVYYSQESFDADGEMVSGSWRCPALWYLEKDRSGVWHVTDIEEHP